MINLPQPSFTGTLAVAAALRQRRSIRSFQAGPVGLEQVAQLLWSAYGITGEEGRRTAPSAKECYPLELSLVAERVTGLAPGTYGYEADRHGLIPRVQASLRKALFETTFNQESVLQAPAILVISAVMARSEPEFGEAARDFVFMEVGHAGQNVHLQAEALGLGTVVIAAFRPSAAARVLGLPEGQTPVYLMPFGHP